MSIYIRGMKMPKDRPQLLWVYPNGKTLTLQSDVDPWKELQAVPVPDHGRLGDLDKLARKIEHDRYNHTHTDGLAGRHHIAEYGHFLNEIANVPTIIPAEENDNDR